jgi:transcriptional regulator with XRE-family HTH domain
MDENIVYENLGKRIKFLRMNAHLTQERLAEKCGISLDYLGKIEVCISKPGLKTIIKIANALELDIKELFDFKS